MEERKYYHYVFTTYNRKYVLNDKDIMENLTKWFNETAKAKQFEIISMNILADHVHVLIEQKINDSPSYIMKCLKGASSYRMFEFYPKTNRLMYRKLWSRSYHCREIHPDELSNIVNYINHQKANSGLDKRFIAGVEKGAEAFSLRLQSGDL